MNDACRTMNARISDLLPGLADNPCLTFTKFKQDVSGNTGTVFELELGKFTEEELVDVFETVVVCHHLQKLAEY